ncbi:MAG: ATP-binding protein [Caldimonas sp.]
MEPSSRGLKSRCFTSIARLAAVIWLVSSICLIVLAERQSTAMFDRILREAGLTILAVIDHELAEIRVGGGPPPAHDLDKENEDGFLYQVWNADGTLAYRSASAPDAGFSSGVPGLQSTRINGVAYRAFTAWNPQQTFQVRIAMLRDRQNAFFILLSAALSLALFATFAAFLFLVRRQLERSFSPLESTARQLADKTTGDLSAIQTPTELPEIGPVIEAFNGLMSRVDRSNRQERRFATDAAHALRTPFSSLKILVRNLQLAKDETERAEALGSMDAVIRRSSELVNQLLRLARFDREPHAVDLSEKIDLVRLAEIVIDEFSPMASERGLFIRRTGALQSLWVSGNRGTLAVALRSIVENAALFAPRYGTVLVEVVHDPISGVGLLRVHDDGPGVERDLQDRMFSLFFKVDRRDSANAGLGLPLVARIAQIHGGLAYVSASSILGGAMAVIRLPCAAGHPTVPSFTRRTAGVGTPWGRHDPTRLRPLLKESGDGREW